MSAIEYPGTRWLVGRAILKTLKQTTLLTMFEIMRNWGMVRNEHYRYDQLNGVIKFWNSSEIYLKDLFAYPSDPDFDQLGSTEYTGAFVDEASQITLKAKNIVISRIRYKLDDYNIIPKILFTSNPSKNFLYEQFYKAWREDCLEDYRKFIPALVTDNPHISHHYIDNLRKLDEVSKQRLLYGNFEYDDDPAKLMEYDMIVDVFRNTHVPAGERYLTADIAMQGQDLFVIVYWEGLRGKVVHVEKQSSGKGIEKTMRELIERYNVPRSHVIYDNAGLGAYLESYLEGIKKFHGGSSAFNHHATNYANLRTECFYKLAELVNQKKLYLECDDRQKDRIISEFEQIKRDYVDNDEAPIRVVRKALMKDNLSGKSPDFVDAISMRMYWLVARERGVGAYTFAL